jgi:two-component system, sporulation sensor kinase D
MFFSNKRNLSRWLIIASSFIIVLLILWNTYSFFQVFKQDERLKMELWAQAQNSIAKANLETDDITLPFQIISTNTSIPIILTTENDSVIQVNNITDDIATNKTKIAQLLKQLKSENQSIRVDVGEGKYRLLYYGNSALLNKLKYYPVALLLIITLFGALIYNFYRATKMASQNKLWAGMAKETAHQIGTPLSSLIGWLEILKLENVETDILLEIEKDINRLQTIADRFSKIGSEPLLNATDISVETKKTFDYLAARSSNQVRFLFEAPTEDLTVFLNPELHGWTIENLVKNAIDAMRGKGELKLKIINQEQFIKIQISDNGKGIAKKEFKTIFEPGFTTKKRGWGLGLSLTKRIVEDYHKGKIKVLQSEIGKGTTFQISYKKNEV